MRKYLSGIDWDPFEGISGIYVTPHHRQGWRYFSQHKNGLNKKELIFQKLAAGGMIETPGAWDWHHIVEGQHLKCLFTGADYDQQYSYEWPTVLIHAREEHHILNSLFRSKEPLQKPVLKDNAALQGKARASYLDALYDHYQNLYTGNPLFQAVAHNVITSLQQTGPLGYDYQEEITAWGKIPQGNNRPWFPGRS